MRNIFNRRKPLKVFDSILLIIFLLGSFNSTAQHDFVCDYEITQETSAVIATSFQAGDTLCLMAGIRGPLYLKNIIGTAENPIVIINKDGQSIIESDFAYGIKFVECSNVILSGAGDQNIEYGIHVREVKDGYGLGIGDKSTDFEVERLEISNTKIAGILAKTDPDCTYTAVRDSFTMYKLKIHDNYLHDIGMEGIYVGSSFFLGQYINNCDTTLMPHIIDGVEIYNNRIEYTGWDGIQVGSALYNCNIRDNYIYKDSQAEETYQMSGILINPGSSCNVYNNRIIDGKGTGIFNQGSGGQKFYNNLIVNAGREYYFEEQSSKQRFGIFSKYTYIHLPGSAFHFYNNTIINPKSDGIRVMDFPGQTNRFINNIIINPGAYDYYKNLGSVYYNANDAYIHNYLDSSLIFSVNNIIALSSKEQFFADTLNYDYHLTVNSPAVNWGYDLSTYGITFDIDKNDRPFDNYFDIGAYELQITIPTDLTKPDNQLNISPNPASDLLSLSFYLDDHHSLNLKLISLDGKEFPIFSDTSFVKGENIKRISIAHLAKAQYILILHNESIHLTKLFQKI